MGSTDWVDVENEGKNDMGNLLLEVVGYDSSAWALIVC